MSAATPTQTHKPTRPAGLPTAAPSSGITARGPLDSYSNRYLHKPWYRKSTPVTAAGSRDPTRPAMASARQRETRSPFVVRPINADDICLRRLPARTDYAAMQTEPPKANEPKRKRRWFQFSVRTLLIGVTLLAISCPIVIAAIK